MLILVGAPILGEGQRLREVDELRILYAQLFAFQREWSSWSGPVSEGSVDPEAFNELGDPPRIGEWLDYDLLMTHAAAQYGTRSGLRKRESPAGQLVRRYKQLTWR